MKEGPINLTTIATQDCYKVGSSISVTITLNNQSSQALWLNRRMGVAYQDSLIRELYFSVHDAETDLALPVPDDMRVDVDRRPPTQNDFQELKPGESVTCEVDLAHWYPFEQRDNYRIVFTYDNEFDGSEFGLSAFVGSVDSNPIDIIIT